MPTTTHSEPQLWGRGVECEALDRLLAAIRAGTSGVLVVRGEPGSGKTALLDYLLAHAAGCRIARAAGVESEMELAFAGLHQLCAPFLGRLARLPGPQRDALTTAFGLQIGPPPDRFLIGLAVLSLLSDVAEEQPLVCVVDDTHWLDRASAQVLGFVARRLAAEAIAVVFAIRRPWDDLDLAGLPDLTIGPLGDVDARAILASAIPGPLDDPVRDRIVAEAGGNPLALLELPRAWTPAAFAGGFGLPDGVSVPRRIEESFRRRMTPLPDHSRQLLLVVAADPVGDPGLIWAAADRLGIPAEAVGPATAAGLLGDGTGIRFRHPLVRSVVYRDASIGDRRRVHAALADVTDRARDPDRRAWHLAAATAGPDDEVAVELERSADRAQARGGIAAAAAFLQRALSLTVEPMRRSERALGAAQASLHAGEFDEALELLAAAESGPLSEFQQAQGGLLRGHVAIGLGRMTDASARLLLKAAGRLEPFDLRLARETYLAAWAVAVNIGNNAGADLLPEICRAMLALPPSPGTPQALDLLVDGLARLSTDGRAAAAGTLRRAAKMLARIPVQDVLRWGYMAVTASAAVWDDEGERRICERQVRLVRDAGALSELPLHLTALGLARAWTGDFAGATSLVTEAESVAAATGSRFAPYTALRLRALQGREPEATSLIALARDLATSGSPGILAMQAHWAAAVLGNGLGRYDEAAAAARQVTSNTFEPWASMWALPELVEAAVRDGAPELARDALARLIATTQPSGTEFALGIEARCRALVAERAAAEALYREAIERLGRTQLRPELARAHLLYGEWLRREGRRVDAREQLRTAHGMLAQIGMEAFAERARHELLATGETVRKRTVETFDELTPQEVQIARLASQGRTNPEIGAELFLSPRTVEWHLRKVFSKLGVASRRELRAALPRMANPKRRG